MSIYYNTCLIPTSYDGLPEAEEVLIFSRGKNFRYEHEHRKWEYGLALRFFKEINPKTVVNVGGGNSPLSSLIASNSVKVTEIDEANLGSGLFQNIEYIFENFPNGDGRKYDLVVATSVIEHVEDDQAFFDALLESANKAVFLTTDFHPSGKPQLSAHLRTYNADGMLSMINKAKEYGFSPYGDISYVFEAPMVNGCTFAALALWKV